MDIELMIFMLTSIEFLLVAGGIFTASFIAIWWIDTEIIRQREQGFSKGLETGREIQAIRDEVLK